MDKLYTIQEVATKLNLSDKTLRRWEDAGKFSSSRTLGNQRRYSLEDLQILDAIKHGTINEQKDLLSIEQASKLCGVGSSSLLRWENDGKVHPFITSGHTYYIRQKLMEKMDELKKSYVEPQVVTAPIDLVEARPVSPTINTDVPKLTSLDARARQASPLPSPARMDLKSSLFNVFITLILILSYHLVFNATARAPLSPSVDTGSVKGAATIADPSLDILHSILGADGAITTSSLTSRLGITSPTLSLLPSSAPISPTPGMIYYDATSQGIKIFKGTGWTELSPTINYKSVDVSMVSGTSSLSKGKNQISVSQEKITPSTPVTVTFTADYAPAKKYWVIAGEGNFTLYTDFPVSTDSSFNYSYLAGPPAATPVASSSATTR